MKDKLNREIDYMRISVTDNCNLRCVYCMDENNNVFLENKDKLSNEEIIKVVTQCAKLGIKKVRITGGEPLLRYGIVNLIKNINEIQGIEEIHLTTNGILLKDKVEDLAKSGLAGVNISLDSMLEERYSTLTRGGKLSDVQKAIDKAMDLGLKVKLNTVIIDDVNKDEIIDFINITKNKDISVRFIELMPIGVAEKYKGISKDHILHIMKNNNMNYEIVEAKKTQGPAKYIKVDGHKGKVGFISAMSNCFCEECNRIRLSAEGIVKQCLHFDYGTDLKKILREGASEEAIKESLYSAIYNKPEKHLFLQESEHKELKFMNQIGG